MNKGKGVGFVLSSTLLFVILILCVILFYTCSLEYNSQQVEDPVVVEEVLAVEEKVFDNPPEIEEIVEESITIEKVPVVEVEKEIIEDPVILISPAPDLDYFVDTVLIEETNSSYTSFFDQEIDWSEFVSSEDVISLPDGTYYATLFINDSEFGSIEFEQINESPFFSRTALELELKQMLSKEHFDIFFSNISDYYDLSYLETVSEKVVYDSGNLVLKLYFNSSQVPLQTLSINSSYSLVRKNYDVVGNVVLKSAAFSLQSNISTFLSILNNADDITNINLSVSLANTFSFWNMTFNLPISLNYSKHSGFMYSVGSWNGYLDFPENSLRLTFGNVGTSGFRNGTAFGFFLEKNYSYGTKTAMGNQYNQIITLVEDSKLTIKVNDNIVFSRNLSLGEYRLTDFTFATGPNDIEVIIHPLSMGSDTSLDTTLLFNQNYDSALLAKGESTWRLGVSIPKISNYSNTGVNDYYFVIPSLSRSSLSRSDVAFNLNAFNIVWEQTVGIMHEYTQNHAFSFTYERNLEDGKILGTFNSIISGTLATKIGTTRATVNASLYSANSERNNLSVYLTQSFSNNKLKPLSLSLNYQITKTYHMMALNAGYSWSIQRTRLSVSLNTSYKFNTIVDKPFNISTNLSLSTTLGNNLAFSLSSSINQDFQFTANASLSFSVGKRQSINSTVNANSSRVAANVGYNFRPSSTSNIQINMSNINFEDVKNHNLSASWSHSSELYGISLRTQANNNYSRFSTTLAINTALAFADGQFALANSLYGPFLIISPEDNLKKSSISVSAATDSSSTQMKKTFGNVIYNKLGMYKNNNVVVYASSGSLFTSAGSFLFKITPVARQGFLAKIKLESSIAISGVLKKDDNTVYDSYSSPIYRVQLDENGIDVISIEIEKTSYFFTDVDGRFIISDLPAGIYMIDLSCNEQWYAAFFEVPQTDEISKVALLKDFNTQAYIGQEVTEKYNIKSFDNSYIGSLYIEFDTFIDENEYWDMIFSIQQENSNLIDEWDFEDEEDLAIYEMINTSAL